MNFEKLRKDFPVLRNNKNLVYFDNGATSLKPDCVIENINKYYKECTSNVHRGIHRLSMESSVIYENTHEKVARFINSKKTEVIFTLNSTDSINQVMYFLYTSDYFKKNDKIISSVMEHHANIVPWQFISKKLNLNLEFIEVDSNFKLDLNDFEKKLDESTKLVTITYISNTIGTINPVKEIIKKAHEKNALVLIDASQACPHMKIDFKELDCDFLVFTAHKMLGPTGIGFLIAKESLLEKFNPFRYGGDMIKNVTLEKSEWNKLPLKFEAGTPNIAGAFGAFSAIDYLENIGMDNISKNDSKLLDYLLEKTSSIKNLEVFNPKDSKIQAPILLFNLKGFDPRVVSSLLDEVSDIATRSGTHCAQPIVTRYNPKGLVRASLYFYNTFEEIDKFVETIKVIDKDFR
ncbi:MAG: cysteine desulfurase [Candidatus ainarchaeum sp.]|nr:cysteine desulfurase [Candidatus ainarchaeum sp.]MDD3975801.1 cysteine desulfurase [Candidatus ainarchaeum sp.]